MKFLVQAYCTGMGWVSTKYGGDTAEEAERAEASMLANDAIWMPGKRETRIIENPFHEMEQAVASKLAESGWTPLENEIAFASKTIQTIVGDKVAFAYLSKGDGYHRTLSGDYQSEGHNVLVTCSRSFPFDVDAIRAASITSEFAASAEEQIAASYAVRLMHNDDPDMSGSSRNMPTPS